MTYSPKKYALITSVQAADNNDGTSSSSTWNVRPLNTLDTNIAGVSLASNQFTLPAGKYHIRINAPTAYNSGSQMRLKNVTDTSYPLVGTPTITTAGSGTQDILVGMLTITASKTFQVEHYTINGSSGDGLGSATYEGSGLNEIYGIVFIEKLD